MKDTVRVKKSGKNLFLLEIIIVMLFFSLSAAIIVQLFAGAYVKSRDGQCLVKAVTAASNYAEVFKSEKGDVIRTAQILEIPKENVLAENLTMMWYDRDFNPTNDEKAAVYELSAGVEIGQSRGITDLAESDPDAVAGLKFCTVTVKKGNDVIFSIQAAS